MGKENAKGQGKGLWVEGDWKPPRKFRYKFNGEGEEKMA